LRSAPRRVGSRRAGHRRVQHVASDRGGEDQRGEGTRLSGARALFLRRTQQEAVLLAGVEIEARTSPIGRLTLSEDRWKPPASRISTRAPDRISPCAKICATSPSSPTST